MADLFDPNVNPSLPGTSGGAPAPFDFQKRKAAMEARQARLTALLRNQITTPNMPQGRMVSGIYVAPSWAENLNAAAQPALSRYAVNQEQAGLEKDIGEYEAEDRKAAIAHAMSAPQGRPELAGPPAEGGSPELAAQPATPADKIAWAEQGMHIPSRRALLTKLIEDQTIQEPVREEGRKEKRLDREDKQAEARATLAANQVLSREKLAQEERLARQRQEDAQAMRLLIQQGQQAAAEGRREQIRLAAEGKSAAESAAHAKERQSITDQARDAQERMELLTTAQAAGKTATGSGLGASADKLASIVGWSTEGAKGAAKLKALQAQLLTLTPKLGGATSDADVRNYREAVGQIGDETLPMETRQAAMDTVQVINKRDYDNALARGREFNARSQGSRPTVQTTPPPNGVRVRSMEEAMKLPPGTEFIDPSGIRRVR